MPASQLCRAQVPCLHPAQSEVGRGPLHVTALVSISGFSVCLWFSSMDKLEPMSPEKTESQKK